MKTSCPGCGCVFDLDAGVSDADARRFAELVAGLDPRVAKPLIQYLALFRPAKTGMRWSRMLSLAQELEPMIREARVTRKGTTYAAPLEMWAGALSMLADRPKNLTLPLKSHGYLLEILANQAEKIAAKQESETEHQKKSHRHFYGGDCFKEQGQPSPPNDRSVAGAKPIGVHLDNLKNAAAGKKP